MPTLTRTITGDTPSSVTLNTLTRADNGQSPVSGLPANFTLSNGVWSYPFTDNTSPLPTAYNYTYTLTWLDGTTATEPATLAAPTPTSGAFITQSGIEGWYGVENVAIWSNKESNNSSADPVALLAAITRAENYLNSRLRSAGYSYPLASTSADYAVWQDIGAEYAGVLLFLGRGEVENEDTKNLAGQMEVHRERVMTEIQRLLSFGLDCPKVASPAVTHVDPRRHAAARGYPIPVVHRNWFGGW